MLTRIMYRVIPKVIKFLFSESDWYICLLLVLYKWMYHIILRRQFSLFAMLFGFQNLPKS